MVIERTLQPLLVLYAWMSALNRERFKIFVKQFKKALTYQAKYKTLFFCDSLTIYIFNMI